MGNKGNKKSTLVDASGTCGNRRQGVDGLVELFSSLGGEERFRAPEEGSDMVRSV